MTSPCKPGTPNLTWEPGILQTWEPYLETLLAETGNWQPRGTLICEPAKLETSNRQGKTLNLAPEPGPTQDLRNLGWGNRMLLTALRCSKML